MQPPKRKKTRRGKRKTPRCRTGRRHTPNAPDLTLDRGGVPWRISDTTDKSIKFTDFDTESTEPSCMPLVYWSTQTNAAINLLRPEQPTNTVYLPYVSTANAAATIIQHAYTKYINHVMPHHHVTTNAPTQFEDKLDAIMRAITTRLNDIKTRLDNNNTQLDTQFDKLIAKLDSYTNTATDNTAGDDRLLDDNG
jgi:flagellar capping protein FliD